MVTEPRRAARKRGTSIKALTAIAALATAGLAGCASHGNAGVSLLGMTAGASGTAGPAPEAPATDSASGAQAGTGSEAASAPASAQATSAAGSTVGGIAAAAWIEPSAIPLNATYHWPSPASAAKAAKSPVLSAVEDCGIALASGERAELGAFPAARAALHPTSGGTGGQDDWTAQETVLATDDTGSGDVQGIYSLYTDLVAAIGRCAQSAPGAKVAAVTSRGSQYAATVTIPTTTGSTLTLHEYLAAPYGYLVELSVWVVPYAGDEPSTAWDGSAASEILSSLQSGPCSITKLC